MASTPLLLHKLVFILSIIFSAVNSAPLNLSRQVAVTDPSPLTLKPQQAAFDFTLASTLITPSSTLSTLSTIPPSCVPYNSADGGECPTYFLASNVTYDDCTDQWTICMCSSANMTIDNAVANLGQVPVGLRRYIATVLVLPGNTTRAYTLTNGDIHFFGLPEVDTWVHESGHAYDYAAGDPHSGSYGWSQALLSDSCVPDNYSATNAAEDFAQQVVLQVYSLLNNNALPDGWSPSCMSNQVAYMSSLPVFDKPSLFGNTCNIQPPDPFSRHSTPPPTPPPLRIPGTPPEPSSTPTAGDPLHSSLSSSNQGNRASRIPPWSWFAAATVAGLWIT